MKRKFSTHWLSSTKARKQRKYIANAPLHIKHKFLNALLSKALKEKYKRKSLPLRKGDEVLIMRGSFKNKKTKVSSINLKKTRILLENIYRTKKDGSKVNVYFHPSKLQIQELNLEDRHRLAIIDRKKEKSVSK